MTAGIWNPTCEQGTTWSRNATYKVGDPPVPVDLTGYTARAAIRRSAQNPELVAQISCTIPTPLTGTVVLSLTAAQTAALPATGSRWDHTTNYVYDVEIESPDGTVIRLLNGEFRVSPEVPK